jgi:hypothetical protein
VSTIKYADRRFTPVALGVIADAVSILAEYQAQGYRMSLRGLYYQYIRRNLFPDSRLFLIPGSDPPEYTKNDQRNYKWLGDLISDARIAGMIDWDYMEDPTRDISGGDGGFASPAAAMRYLTRLYAITHWGDQDNHVELWVEKAALLPVLEPVARRWKISVLACKGSPSTSAMHEAALRLRRHEREGRKVTILYLGDHDPTGLDISRDIQDRLELFRCDARVDRLALNIDQITDDLPPSPAKVTDSRAAGYIALFGTDSWELDAMEPAVMDALADGAIQDLLDHAKWAARDAQEERERQQVLAVSDNWAAVQRFIRDNG